MFSVYWEYYTGNIITMLTDGSRKIIVVLQAVVNGGQTTK